MAYLRAGSFTQSNDDPCSPAGYCFSSHRCNYCAEAWLAKMPHSREEDHNSLLFILPQIKKKTPPKLQSLCAKCGVNGLICNIEIYIGGRSVHRLSWCINYCWRWCACLAPTSEKWDDKRGNFPFLSRWCVIVWATVRGETGRGGSVWGFSLPIPSDKDFNSQ